MPAVEPPRFSSGGTVGRDGGGRSVGTGARQCRSGGASCVGVTLLNGRGEVLNSAGRFAKNVAGYDVSRLMRGLWVFWGSSAGIAQCCPCIGPRQR